MTKEFSRETDHNLFIQVKVQMRVENLKKFLHCNNDESKNLNLFITAALKILFF